MIFSGFSLMLWRVRREISFSVFQLFAVPLLATAISYLITWQISLHWLPPNLWWQLLGKAAVACFSYAAISLTLEFRLYQRYLLFLQSLWRSRSSPSAPTLPHHKPQPCFSKNSAATPFICPLARWQICPLEIPSPAANCASAHGVGSIAPHHGRQQPRRHQPTHWQWLEHPHLHAPRMVGSCGPRFVGRPQLTPAWGTSPTLHLRHTPTHLQHCQPPHRAPHALPLLSKLHPTNVVHHGFFRQPFAPFGLAL
ncbi:MAG: hypothetical protein IPL28_00135 [Chloroflexi bacterium]|nr:hypothetical protein [Chloroflexota bacterium]